MGLKMTIKELVESLKGLDENSDVVIVFSSHNDASEIVGIYDCTTDNKRMNYRYSKLTKIYK